MTVAVVTPWHQHLELQPDYDRALELGPWPDELLIVDNGSNPPLEFAAIRNDENLGFCQACNQGLEAASSDVVVFLNNDVSATEQGWLEELYDTVEPSVLVGARLRSRPARVGRRPRLPVHRRLLPRRPPRRPPGDRRVRHLPGGARLLLGQPPLPRGPRPRLHAP